MSAYEDVERYRKLLEDWKPGPGTPPAASSRPQRAAAPASQPSVQPPANGMAETEEVHSPGAILLLGGSTLAIYRRCVPDKGYHLIIQLNPNGSAKNLGVALAGYTIEEIGTLPQPMLDKLLEEMRWDRDLIVFHCYRYEDVAKIPQGGAPRDESRPASSSTPIQSVASPEPEPLPHAQQAPAQPGSPAPLRRGQRLQIRFGSNMWDAVYWGHDDQGQVVAHKTHHVWALMHLDLDRFANSMQVDPQIDEELIQEIETSLTASA